MLDIKDMMDVSAITLGAVEKNGRGSNFAEVKINGEDAIKFKFQVGGANGACAPFGIKAGEYEAENAEKIAMALTGDAALEALAKAIDEHLPKLVTSMSKQLFGAPRTELQVRDKQTPLFKPSEHPAYPAKVPLKVRVVKRKDKHGNPVGQLTRVDFATLDPGATRYRYVPGVAADVQKGSRIIAQVRIGPVWTNATKAWGVTLEAMHLVVFPPPEVATTEEIFHNLPAPPDAVMDDVDDSAS